MHWQASGSTCSPLIRQFSDLYEIPLACIPLYLHPGCMRLQARVQAETYGAVHPHRNGRNGEPRAELCVDPL